ncbi:hypothetical protein EDB80DRAFT_675131 [Ilyonectria destructans]|nr:hypothetical protein EDB80DRAFT_675131 [Ilyonectria destructans]
MYCVVLQDVCEGMYVLSAYVAGYLGSMRERVWSNKISVQAGRRIVGLATGHGWLLPAQRHHGLLWTRDSRQSDPTAWVTENRAASEPTAQRAEKAMTVWGVKASRRPEKEERCGRGHPRCDLPRVRRRLRCTWEEPFTSQHADTLPKTGTGDPVDALCHGAGPGLGPAPMPVIMAGSMLVLHLVGRGTGTGRCNDGACLGARVFGVVGELGVGGCLDDSDLGGDLAVLASHSEASDRGAPAARGTLQPLQRPYDPDSPYNLTMAFWMAGPPTRRVAVRFGQSTSGGDAVQCATLGPVQATQRPPRKVGPLVAISFGWRRLTLAGDGFPWLAKYGPGCPSPPGVVSKAHREPLQPWSGFWHSAGTGTGTGTGTRCFGMLGARSHV